MNNCSWCNLTDEDRKYLLYENQYWSVYLADEQDYVGRCIVVSRRHCASLAEFGHHYAPHKKTQLQDADRESLFMTLKQRFGT